MMLCFRRACRFVLWLALIGLSPVALAGDPEPVRLQLKWRHQFQFAGYYAALEKGYYREAGFDVTLLPARPGTDSIREVVAGHAEFGVASAELVQRFAVGDPVVALAVIFQHSPLVLFARREAGIASVQDLQGKRVALAESETELFAYLRREGVPAASLVRERHHFTADALLNGRVDALAGYDTDEAWHLRAHPEAWIRFTPRAAGIDFYGDTLFTASARLAADPERVQAFTEASLRGWRYALDHPEEIIALIHRRYAPDLPVDKLRFEAEQMAPLIRSDMVAVGYSHEDRWRHILQTYESLGLVPEARRTDLRAFLFRPVKPLDYRWLVWVVLAVLGGLAVVSGLASRFHRLNRELTRQLHEIQALQEQLRQEAVRDALTGLFNRRYLNETLPRELARASRDGQTVTMAALDLDEFKQINDRLGHAAGDEVLQAIGNIIREGCRESDIPCRMGGDELVVVLLNATPKAVAARIERWRVRMAEFRFHGEPLPVTFSAGIASSPPVDAGADSLLLAADKALYQAKGGGRNRTVMAPASRP